MAKKKVIESKAQIGADAQRKVCRLIEQFVPKEAILEIIKQLDPKMRDVRLAEKIFLTQVKTFSEREDWRARLEDIFDGDYPERIREFICDGRFAVKGKTQSYSAFATYKTSPVKLFERPSEQQLRVMGPAMLKVVYGDKGTKVLRSVDLDRLKLLERDAVARSALVVFDVRNRPAVGIKDRWELGEDIPQKIITPKLTSRASDASLIQNFFVDLRKTIAWKDDESFAVYLAYLLQPMLAHIKPGMNPAYLFRGVTNSGKGFLSKQLPTWLYASTLKEPALLRDFPSGEYEFSVTMAAARHSLYCVFDEIKNITEDQTKIFDYAITSSEISMRIMREGVQQIPNHLTFAATAVSVNFASDETWGRLACIELIESRTQEIEAFLNRWRTKAPDLLSSLFRKLRGSKSDVLNFSVIPGRRPGFGLLARAVEIAFGVRPAFSASTFVNDVLEAICGLEAKNAVGDRKGARKRLSRAQIGEELRARYGMAVKPSELLVKLKTAMGTGATRFYESESGVRFKIDLSIEGGDGRAFVYVQRTSKPSTVSTDSMKSKTKRQIKKV